ncbi:eCIS core domain-containing protein [Nostoc sp.]|uniref:eCIS core domain-containing protein n=1 Tax=Nostoc sp. TaxID=1180 RepID=UPI002FF7A00D
MISKIIAQSDRQQKSEKPQESGILQRANVRLVADAGIQSTDDQEEVALSNSTFSKDFSRVPITTTKPQPIMAKLTIGAVGDKYEQEADRVAAQVVQRINAPASLQSGEDETVQRENMETEDNEARLMRSPILQRMSSDGGMAAAPDLEASINQARGGGQVMTNNIRQPMEQAFGADFSRVKIHTGAQSDQLNQSIQARAFTTGQDVFFRQGEYNLGSRRGQELLAHELTHVVQQKSSVVQRVKHQGKQESLFTKKVNQYDGNSFLGIEFTRNHLTNNKKLKGKLPTEVAKGKAQERGLTAHTQLIMDTEEIKKLGNEIKSKNSSQFYYKKFKKENKPPQDVKFLTDMQIEYVTINSGTITEHKSGRIYYTVANAGVMVENIPLYCINHLENMQATSELNILSEQTQEEHWEEQNETEEEDSD